MKQIPCIFLNENHHYMDVPNGRQPLWWPGSFDKIHVGTSFKWITDKLEWGFSHVRRGEKMPRFKMVEAPKGVKIRVDNGNPTIEFTAP